MINYPVALQFPLPVHFDKAISICIFDWKEDKRNKNLIVYIKKPGMTTVTVDMPDKDKRDLSSFVRERGGEILDIKKSAKVADESESEDDDEVTHGEFFGENIRRAINILQKH